MADKRLSNMMKELGISGDISSSQHIVKEERWEIPSRYEVTKSVTMGSGMYPQRESNLSSTTIERRYIVDDQAESAYRKSFISALPENMRSEVVKRSQVEKIVTSNEKRAMGTDLELLVFLLSVEVERLNGECESWKFRYTDLDRRISDRQAVEEELRQATVRFNEMKVQYTIILEENERYKVLIGRLQEEVESWKVKYGSIDFSLQSKYEMSEKRVSVLMQEIESWKQKYIALERAKDKEMEELRLTFEARRKSYIEREVRELTLRFQNDRANYENELKRFRELLEMRTRELDEWKTRYSKLEITITDLRGNETKLREYENRIALLSQEIERLNVVLKARLEEIETWRLNYNKLEIRIKDLQAYEAECGRLRELLEGRAREIDEWKSRYSRIEVQITDLRSYEPKLRDYENRIALLTQEIERLNQILRSKNDEIDGWRTKYSKIEITINEYKAYEVRLKEYENRIALLTQEIERLNGLLRSRGEEIDSWKSRYSKLEITITELRAYEGRLGDYENRIALLTQEIERLNSILRQRAEEIDQWRVRYAKLESTLNDYKVFEARTKEYEQRIAMLLKEIDDWKTRYSKLEITLVEYRAYEDRLKEYENRIGLLTQEIERLNSVLRQRAEEIDNWKSRYSKIEISITEYKGLEGRLREYENRIALLSQEIERLNGVLKARADEIEQWRVNYSKLEITINDYKIYEGRNKDMENRMSLMLREIDDWKSRYSKLEITLTEYRNLEGRLKEYENRIALLTQEIERLNNVLRARLEEIEGWRGKYSKLEIAITELRGYEGRSREYEQRISALLGEIENWKSRYSKLELTIVELRSYESRLKEYENRIALLTQEIERLNNILRSKNGEIEDWRGRYAKLEMTLLEYKDYEKRIRVLSQEIDRLNSIIHENEEELGKWRLKYVEYSSLNNRIQEQLALFVMAFAEIESLRSRVIEKEREVEEVRRSNLAPYRK